MSKYVDEKISLTTYHLIFFSLPQQSWSSVGLSMGLWWPRWSHKLLDTLQGCCLCASFVRRRCQVFHFCWQQKVCCQHWRQNGVFRQFSCWARCSILWGSPIPSVPCNPKLSKQIHLLLPNFALENCAARSCGRKQTIIVDSDIGIKKFQSKVCLPHIFPHFCHMPHLFFFKLGNWTHVLADIVEWEVATPNWLLSLDMFAISVHLLLVGS